MRYYVHMTDNFLNDCWGLTANELINKYVFVCNSHKEALILADNARKRSDTSHVRVDHTAPHFYRENPQPDHLQWNGYRVGNYYVQNRDITTHPQWFREGEFDTNTERKQA